MTKTKNIYNPDHLDVVHNNDNDSIEGLEIHLEPEQKEGYVKGEVLAERMKDKGLNSNALKKLLDNPKLIPKEWKKYYGIYFWGTIFRDPDGDFCVRYLYWSDGGWHWSRHWLNNGWHSSDPAAVSASSQTSEPDSKPSVTLSLEMAIKVVKDAGYQVSKLI